jgi:hypothetical protein
MSARLPALILALAAICAAAQAAPPAPARPARSARAALGDKELEAAIRARFARSKINEDRFTVHVQGGVATIEGRTNVLQHKGVATRLAKAAGARAVVNRVEPSEEAKLRASENLAKGRRRAQLRRGQTRSERAER